jgi:hypothetical protein
MGCFWRVYVCLVDEEEKERKAPYIFIFYRWKERRIGVEFRAPSLSTMPGHYNHRIDTSKLDIISICVTV